jgi:hypothetical protein
MSGWTSDWPDGVSFTDSTGTYKYIQAWEFIVQAWFALRQRHAVLNGYVSPPELGLNGFPQPNPIWDFGIVDSITVNDDATITIAMSSINWAVSEGCTSPKWVDYSCSGCANAHIPSAYDLIIDPMPNAETVDPRLTVRGNITAATWDGTSTGTLTISRGDGPSLFPTDAIAANYIPSLSSLVGQNWYILQSEGWWVSERLPDRPDDQQQYVGDSCTGGNVTVASHVVTVVSGSYTTSESAYLAGLPNGSYSTLADEDAAWSPEHWSASSAKEVLYFGSDSALHRDTVTHNSATLLVFTNHTAWTAGGSYIIVDAGKKGFPGRTLTPIFQWYTGIGNGYKTHLANDSIGEWPLAAYFAASTDGDNCEGECESTTVNAFDSSAQIDQFNDCAGSSAGLFLSPKYTKCLRSIQTDIIGLCSSFLPYQDYTGQAFINSWTPATFFLAVGINAFSCGFSYVDSSTLTVSGAPNDSEFPLPCWYTLLNADGSIAGNSTGTLTNATTLSGSFSNSTPEPTTVVIALGFTRFKPRDVRHFYPKAGFVPTYDLGVFDPPSVDFDDSGNVIDHTGIWSRRDKSATYKNRSTTGGSVDGSIAFIDQELATHVGDNATEGCVFTSDGVGVQTSEGDSTQSRVPYWDHFYRGKYDQELESRRLASLIGTATDFQNGTNNYALTDANQQWWQDGINGNFSTTSAGLITSVIDNGYDSLGNSLLGSATVAAAVPDQAVACSYVVTNMGATILKGTSSVTPGSTATISGFFHSAMVGDTVTMTFQGSLHVETGTATSGNTTSLTDTTHVTTGSTNPLSCWWSSRFLGFSDPSAYTDFILVISQAVASSSSSSSSGTATRTWRVPITSTTSGSGGVVIHFAAVTGLTVHAGDKWSITEPAYEVNKWEDRVVTLNAPPMMISSSSSGMSSSSSGVTNVYQAKITHSDNNTIFFGQVYDSNGSPTSVTLSAGWTYSIDDRRFGGTYRWDADGGLDGTGGWIIPTGNDVVRRGVVTPQPFQADITMNLPTIVKDYGRIMVDDIMCTEIFTEMQTAINAMIATKRDPDGWYKNRVAGTPEVWKGSTDLNNYPSNFFGTFDDYPCYGGPDPRYPCSSPPPPCVSNPSDNEAVVVYLLQPGSCYYSCPSCIDYTGWGTYPADDGALPFGPYVNNAYASEFQYDGSGTLMGGLQGVAQTAVSGYLRISNVPTIFSATIDFYDFAAANGSCPDVGIADARLGSDVGNLGTTCQPCTITFDDYGQPVIWRRWKKFDSESIASDGTAASTKLGDVGGPYPPSPVRPCYDGTTSAVVFSPPAYPYDAASTDGYKVTDQTAILKWGFTYV